MKLHIAIVDDSESDRKKLLAMLEESMRGQDYTVSEFDGAESFLKTYRKGDFQILYLDICMNDMNGISLAQKLRIGDKKMEIIYVSTTTEFMIKTFSTEPVGYLCKPFRYEDFCETTKRACSHFQKSAKKILIHLPRQDMEMDIYEMISAVSDSHTTEISLVTGQKIRSLNNYTFFQEVLLKEDCFIECNRGIIVNLNYAFKLEGDSLVMQDQQTYPVRRRDRSYINAQITKYITIQSKGGYYT